MSIPHFSFPFRVVDGSAAVVEQDDPTEVEQGVVVLVLTEKGERLEVPDFGVQDPTFRTTADPDEVTNTALIWDDRAEILTDREMTGMVETARIYVEENNA